MHLGCRESILKAENFHKTVQGDRALVHNSVEIRFKRTASGTNAKIIQLNIWANCILCHIEINLEITYAALLIWWCSIKHKKIQSWCELWKKLKGINC